VEGLAGLDPDDPRPPSQQIANVLRAAIRTRKFKPGEKLPSQNELAARFNVARETVKVALRILRDERLIVTRQGSGAFVRAQIERPVGLRPHIESAFERAHISIDFAGFSGETLHGALTEPLDKIRAGLLNPKSISVRILIPDTSEPMALPCLAETRRDDPRVRRRAERITQRHIEATVDAIHEVGHLGLVEDVYAEVRVHRAAPLFKLYIINGEEVFFGFYPVVEHTVSIGGDSVNIYDPMGKDAILFHRALNDSEASDSAQYVQQARAWFDSIWSTIAYRRP